MHVLALSARVRAVNRKVRPVVPMVHVSPVFVVKMRIVVLLPGTARVWTVLKAVMVLKVRVLVALATKYVNA